MLILKKNTIIKESKKVSKIQFLENRLAFYLNNIALSFNISQILNNFLLIKYFSIINAEKIRNNLNIEKLLFDIFIYYNFILAKNYANILYKLLFNNKYNLFHYIF